MRVEETKKIYDQMRSSKQSDFVDSLIASAVRYAQIRVDWQLATSSERRAMEDTRTRAHTAFIDSCNILSRNMGKAGEDNSRREKIGQDRKTMGDFACHLHCFLGILAR